MESVERGMRLRLLTLALGIRPGTLGQALGTNPVRTSGLLGGYRPLREAERRALKRVISRAVDAVFSAGGPHEMP